VVAASKTVDVGRHA